MKTAWEAIDRNAEAVVRLAKDIWQHPETAYQEHHAAKVTAAFLREHGFAVEEYAFGLSTALRAVWGEGKPSVGLSGGV